MEIQPVFLKKTLLYCIVSRKNNRIIISTKDYTDLTGFTSKGDNYYRFCFTASSSL